MSWKEALENYAQTVHSDATIDPMAMHGSGAAVFALDTGYAVYGQNTERMLVSSDAEVNALLQELAIPIDEGWS